MREKAWVLRHASSVVPHHHCSEQARSKGANRGRRTTVMTKCQEVKLHDKEIHRTVWARRGVKYHLISTFLPWATFHCLTLLKAPSNMALNTSRDESCTTSLGNLFHCLTTFKVKNVFLISKLNLHLSVSSHILSSVRKRWRTFYKYLLYVYITPPCDPGYSAMLDS